MFLCWNMLVVQERIKNEQHRWPMILLLFFYPQQMVLPKYQTFSNSRWSKICIKTAATSFRPLFLHSFQLRICMRILNILLNQPWFLSATGFFRFRFFGFFLTGILLFLLFMRLFIGRMVYRLVLLAKMLLILRLCNLIFGLFKLRIILFGLILFLVKY